MTKDEITQVDFEQLEAEYNELIKQRIQKLEELKKTTRIPLKLCDTIEHIHQRR